MIGIANVLRPPPEFGARRGKSGFTVFLSMFACSMVIQPISNPPSYLPRRALVVASALDSQAAQQPLLRQTYGNANIVPQSALMPPHRQ